MTWLINAGMTTGFCLVDGGEVRYRSRPGHSGLLDMRTSL